MLFSLLYIHNAWKEESRFIQELHFSNLNVNRPLAHFNFTPLNTLLHIFQRGRVELYCTASMKGTYTDYFTY